MIYFITFILLLVAADLICWALSRRKSRALSRPKKALSDTECIDQGICPDCGATGSLLEGPAAGMGQDIACDHCLSEFMVGFGFGTGAFMVDRLGKLTYSRARLYGIGPEQVATSLGDPA